MTEKKQKRYPTDRLKLHALLEKKEKELVDLREEVEEIRKLVQQADASAINATAAQYNVTPEQLAEIMKKLYGDKTKPVPELPQSVKDAGRQPAERRNPLMMTMRKRGRRMILLLLIASMLRGICPGMAETVNDLSGVETPVLPVNPYRIVLVAPGGWTNNNGAEINATVTDKESIGWQKIEYRMNGGSWTDCEDRFDKGKAEITVHENGTFMLRVTDPYDRTF